MNFIQFIKDNTELTTEQEVAMLDDFCTSQGYDENNQGETKVEFANRMIAEWVKNKINSRRESVARSTASFTEFEF